MVYCCFNHINELPVRWQRVAPHTSCAKVKLGTDVAIPVGEHGRATVLRLETQRLCDIGQWNPVEICDIHIYIYTLYTIYIYICAYNTNLRAPFLETWNKEWHHFRLASWQHITWLLWTLSASDRPKICSGWEPLLYPLYFGKIMKYQISLP